MHRCNETDRERFFDQESLLLNEDALSRNWHNAFCPDNLKDISLVRDVRRDMRKSIWIEAYTCTWEGCKSEEEIGEFL